MKYQKIFFGLIFIAFFLRGTIFLDPDFGWHVRAGQVILEKGIQRTDPFSYTMPSFPFIDHEWLTNISFALIYPFSGTIGLNVIFALIATLTLLIQFSYKGKKIILIPAILAFVSLFPISGVRPQVLTWLFLSLLLRVSIDFNLWEKWRFILPLIFLLWVNLHGGFVIGFFVLIIVISVRCLMKKKIILKDLILLFLLLLISFINPYGPRIWIEEWMQLSDTNLRFSIGEWTPSFFIANFAMWFYFTMSIVLVFFYRRKYNFLELSLYLFLFIGALSSVRNAPFFIIISLSLTARAIHYLFNQASLIRKGRRRFNIAYKFLFITIFVFSFFQIILDFNNARALSEISYYPGKATVFLKENQGFGRIFSVYEWGGYLDWKMPEKKVFIDGRMPSWRQEAAKNESSNAFDEYNKLIRGEIKLKDVVEKYKIEVFLIPVEKRAKKSLLTQLEDSLGRFLGKEKGKTIYMQLKEEGWKKIYQDNIAVIYKK